MYIVVRCSFSIRHAVVCQVVLRLFGVHGNYYNDVFVFIVLLYCCMQCSRVTNMVIDDSHNTNEIITSAISTLN